MIRVSLHVSDGFKKTKTKKQNKLDTGSVRRVSSIQFFFISFQSPKFPVVSRADGIYETARGTKAAIDPSGRVQWPAPASFKSSCSIDVTYFPFDQQECTMRFGSWTYNMDEVGVTMVTVAGVHDEVRLVDLQHGRGRRNHGNGSRSAR